MKKELSSVDLRVLVGELGGVLSEARFDKAYQLGPRILKIRFHVSGEGSRDLVVAPNFMCLTSYARPALKEPSSFVMQLRKHLKGTRMRDVRQHNFDRIVEFTLEGVDRTYVLIVELFGGGNIILCDSDKTIVGLLEWQRWRDRMLGVGRGYEYPPESVNPVGLDYRGFRDVLLGSEKNVASTLASVFGLGGFYAEEVLLEAGVEKNIDSCKLTDAQLESVYASLGGLLSKAVGGELKPQVVLDEGGVMVDVLFYDALSCRGFGRKSYGSFNEVVDEYFSGFEADEREGMLDAGFRKKLGLLNKIRATQEEALSKLRKQQVDCKDMGDAVYQNMDSINAVVEQIKKARSQGLSDGEIMERFGEGKKKKIREALMVVGLDKNKLILEL